MLDVSGSWAYREVADTGIGFDPHYRRFVAKLSGLSSAEESEALASGRHLTG